MDNLFLETFFFVASSREDAWIETYLHQLFLVSKRRVLPRGRVD